MCDTEDKYVVAGFIVQKHGNFRKTYYYVPELQEWITKIKTYKHG